jgi:hypothetical protein
MAKKKYKVIAKVGKDKFVRYNVNNLMTFTSFLEREFKGFYWFNVYKYTKDGSGQQLANFTNKNKPQRPHLDL